MCRQAWFKPGDSARDPKALMEFFSSLERSCGGHGNGAGWMDDETGKYEHIKGLRLSVRQAAEYVANRPKDAWGTFHTRLVSTGKKDTEGCHPHVYGSTDDKRLVMLTHNGTWSAWSGACLGMNAKYPTDSATICALVAMYGWRRVAPVVDETIVCAIRGEKGVYVRAWRDTCPLVLLANDGVASEGGEGEFKAEKDLCKGGHDLRKPRTEKLSKSFSGHVYSNMESWLGDHYPSGGRGPYGRDAKYLLPGIDSSDAADREEKDEMYGWRRCPDGVWREMGGDKDKDTKGETCLLPGVVDVTADVTEDGSKS